MTGSLLNSINTQLWTVTQLCDRICDQPPLILGSEAVTLVTLGQKWHHLCCRSWYCSHSVVLQTVIPQGVLHWYFSSTAFSHILEYSGIVLAEVQQATMPPNRSELFMFSIVFLIFRSTRSIAESTCTLKITNFYLRQYLFTLKSCMLVLIGCPNTSKSAKHLLHSKILVCQ